MQTCDTILYADTIVTQNETREVIRNASLAIDKGRIAAVGTRAHVTKYLKAKKEIDLGHVLLMPGLINTHTHAAMTFLRGFADDLPLMDWLKKSCFPVEAHLTEEIVYLSTLLAAAEMLRTGTTAMQDLYYFGDTVLKAADKAGIRCTYGETLMSGSCPGCASAEVAFDRIRRLNEHYRDNPRLNLIVYPHALYTSTPELLKEALAFAKETGLPMHTHLAETTTETAISLERFGKRPIAYMGDIGLFEHSITLAHVVDTTDEELDCLANGKVVVAHNPSSNMKLASGVARIGDMIDRGITVSLGTDGAASNNRLNMFTEMGRAALLAKVSKGDPTVLPAQTVLDMATIGGAAGIHDETIGSLEVGKAADCIALNLDEPNLLPLFNEPSQLVYAATGMECVMTMVEGEILYRNGAFTRFDYRELLREVEKLRDFTFRWTA